MLNFPPRSMDYTLCTLYIQIIYTRSRKLCCTANFNKDERDRFLRMTPRQNFELSVCINFLRAIYLKKNKVDKI